MKTNKEINLGGKTYEFTYEEKNVKNINIRFTLEKGLSVSAPFGTDYAYVEKLLIENKMKVISSFEEIEKARKGTTANNTKEKKRKSCDNVTVTLNGIDVKCDITYKSVKNINIAVSIDKGVRVSAPKGTSLKKIKEVLLLNADFVTNTLNKQEKIKQDMPKPNRFVTGEEILFLGERKKLIVINNSNNKCLLNKDVIVMYVEDTDDIPLKKAVFEDFLRKQAQLYIPMKCVELYPRFRKKGIAIPNEIKYRKMVSCWGICRDKQSLLTFNIYLMQLPEKCIELVICHEFTHFLYPDHSKDFYAQLDEFMPERKKYEKLTKELQKEIIFR